jgi:hypothetical protein
LATGVFDQPTPPSYLMLGGAPLRQRTDSSGRTVERDELIWPSGDQQPVALWPAAVQVHRDVVAKTTTGRRAIQIREREHGVDHALAAQPVRYGNRSCQ